MEPAKAPKLVPVVITTEGALASCPDHCAVNIRALRILKPHCDHLCPGRRSAEPGSHSSYASFPLATFPLSARQLVLPVLVECQQDPGFTLFLFCDLDFFSPSPCKTGDVSIYRGYFLGPNISSSRGQVGRPQGQQQSVVSTMGSVTGMKDAPYS